MKIFKELKEQYAWLWWWLLEQGIVVATILVHFFFLSIFIVAMTAFYFVMRWLKGH
jgi:hypothetical protein